MLSEQQEIPEHIPFLLVELFRWFFFFLFSFLILASGYESSSGRKEIGYADDGALWVLLIRFIDEGEGLPRVKQVSSQISLKCKLIERVVLLRSHQDVEWCLL